MYFVIFRLLLLELLSAFAFVPQTRCNYLNRNLDIYAYIKLWIHLLETDQIVNRLQDTAVGEDWLSRIRINVAEYVEW